jgi:hypothetical protein
VSFPTCAVGDGPLDLDKTGWRTDPHSPITCKRCLAKIKRTNPRWYHLLEMQEFVPCPITNKKEEEDA